MLFVGTSIIHPSTEGVFLLCNILDLLIYRFYQVSEMVGYEDANYFAKIFKKKTGVTPTEYKESLQMR